MWQPRQDRYPFEEQLLPEGILDPPIEPAPSGGAQDTLSGVFWH